MPEGYPGATFVVNSTSIDDTIDLQSDERTASG
jgi:hypothetical protein